MATPAGSALSLEDYQLIAEGGHDWDSWIRPTMTAALDQPGGLRHLRLQRRGMPAMKRFPWPLVAKDDHVTFELFDHLVGEHRPGNDLPVRLVRKDGSVIWVTASWQPLHDARGGYQGVLPLHPRPQLEPAQPVFGSLSARGHRAARGDHAGGARR